MFDDVRRGPFWAALFQDAALDPSRWLASLGALADATGSARAQLIGFGHANAVPFNWITGMSAAAIADFDRLGMHTPDVNFRTNANLFAADDAIVHEEDYRSAQLRVQSDSYTDFCRDIGISLGCQTNLAVEHGALIGLALLREDRDGATTPEVRAEFARAAAAASGAVRLQRAIEHQGAAIMTGTLEAVGAACFLLDEFGRITSLTPSAEREVARGGALAIVDRRLASTVARGLDDAVRTVLSQGLPTSVRLDARRRLDLFPVVRREWTMGFAPAAIAVVRDPERSLRIAVAAVAADCGLSSAEAAVMALVARGCSRREIAVRRGVSEQTVRAQIKAIYVKTGCGREAELISLIGDMRTGVDP